MATRKKKTIPFKFGPKHIEYIRACQYSTYNILEGAVRSGKTIDNVYAFAHELKTCPDKIHLATGSTMANAKLNIGDANGLAWSISSEVSADGVNIKTMIASASKVRTLVSKRK